MSAQEQALNTRSVTHKMYHTVQDPRCRLCKQHAEIVAQITSGCSRLAGTKYIERHNCVVSIVYRAICAGYNLEHSKNWWVEPDKVVRNNHANILWDFSIQTDKHLLHNWPDIVLINYEEQISLIIDVSVPRDKTSKTKKSKDLQI